MTTISAPLNIRIYGTDVTALSVDVSGTANFTGDLAIPGRIQASTTAVFSGVIRAGGPTAPGYVVLTQTMTVNAVNSAGNASVLTIPPNSDLIEIYVDTVESWNAGSLGTAGTIEVGVSGSTQYFAVIPVSATGTRTLGSTFKTTTIKRWRNFSALSGDATGNIRAFVTAATQQATAMTIGETVLTVVYAQKV